MINLHIKLESCFKIVILAFFLLVPATLLAEISVKKWSKECDEKKNCFIAIKSEIDVPDSDKKQTLATVYIQLASKEDKLIPVIFIKLPLNTDLSKKPLIQIDKKSIGNINFSHCNNSEGCSSNLMLKDEAIKFFKEGNELTVTFGVHRSKQNMAVNFPLKNFTKSFDNLLK
jgi:invasion protein IalB